MLLPGKTEQPSKRKERLELLPQKTQAPGESRKGKKVSARLLVLGWDRSNDNVALILLALELTVFFSSKQKPKPHRFKSSTPRRPRDSTCMFLAQIATAS